ncbi:hypothetical protein GCM10009409_19290 [Shewanella saliphila]|uniref:Uncharacterized protein n=1 Tax=Shewanella saliphila TaxID=2282698 RepID=A0ABQ2Q6B2_9GAMM|nr:hypothetical protein GCM10009409_19290 [Shewanella saliphila]
MITLRRLNQNRQTHYEWSLINADWHHSASYNCKTENLSITSFIVKSHCLTSY